MFVATPKKITIGAVVAVLKEIAAAEPYRVDPQVREGQPARYLRHGFPNGLVAEVLSRLGYSTAVLGALDAELPTGELVHAGVNVEESRHAAMRKLDPTARELLQYLQSQQGRGASWGVIISNALTPSRFVRWNDRRRKPWLFA